MKYIYTVGNTPEVKNDLTWPCFGRFATGEAMEQVYGGRTKSTGRNGWEVTHETGRHYWFGCTIVCLTESDDHMSCIWMVICYMIACIDTGLVGMRCDLATVPSGYQGEGLKETPFETDEKIPPPMDVWKIRPNFSTKKIVVCVFVCDHRDAVLVYVVVCKLLIAKLPHFNW